MKPLAFARGLQLARSDKAAASGCMTLARQRQALPGPIGGGTLDSFPWQRFLPGTQHMFSWGKARTCKPLAPANRSA